MKAHCPSPNPSYIYFQKSTSKIKEECLLQNGDKPYSTSKGYIYQPQKWNKTLFYKYQKGLDNRTTNNLK